jgi:RNA-binding protein YlmH
MEVSFNLFQHCQQDILEKYKQKINYLDHILKLRFPSSRSASSNDAISVRGNGCFTIGKWRHKETNKLG